MISNLRPMPATPSIARLRAAAAPAVATVAVGPRQDTFVRSAPPALVDGYRDILRNPADVNGVHSPAGEEAPITPEPRTNPAQTAAALRALPAARRAQVDAVMAALLATGGGREALNRLAVEDRLVGGPTNQEGADLLESLSRLARQPLAAPLERGRLLDGLVQEIADPAAIDQHISNTCAPAVLQQLLAERDPAELTRLVGGLASPAGQVRLRDGSTFARVPGTERARPVTTEAGTPGARLTADLRTDSSRLFQSAGMSRANDGLAYDPIQDVSRDPRHPGAAPMVNTGSTGPAVLSQAVLGRNTERVRIENDRSNVATTLARLEAAVRQAPTPVNVRFGGAKESFTHELLVRQVDASWVTYRNPWGTEERMSRAQFEARLRNAFFTDAQAHHTEN